MPNTISYKELPIWQRAMQLVADIYQMSAMVAPSERLGLITSLQEIAITIPAKLAAGTRRGRSGFQAACLSSQASVAEVETLVLIIQQAYPAAQLDDIFTDIDQLEHGLVTMIDRLGAHATSSKSKPKTV